MQGKVSFMASNHENSFSTIMTSERMDSSLML
jgi:hypothetical protein